MEKSIKAEDQSSSGSQKSRIAKLERFDVAPEWPQSVVDLAGDWADFPSLEEVRSRSGKNVNHKTF